ncbi:MAG: ABC transporter permease [Polyangiales bacterium]
MKRFLAIAWKELLQLRRDRMTLGMMIGLPVMQLLLFGYAINTDVRHMPLAVYDQDGSQESRDLVERMLATDFYDLAGRVRNYEEMQRALRSGRARVAIVLPVDFGERLRTGTGAKAQLVVDGSDPQTVGSATNTATALASGMAVTMMSARLERVGAGLGVVPFELEPTTWYNPELETAIYVVPGLIGVILTMTMIMLTSMAIARERERGTLEQLIVSPIRSIELTAGKIVPYIAIGYVQMSLVLAVGHFVFGVPLRGSLPMLYGLALVFIAACLAIGLVFSTIAQTQQQAMQMSFFFLLPNILLSGFMFPFEGMPKPAQYLSQCLPLTHFHRVVRGITLKGGGFDDVSTEWGWICVILVVLVTVASLRFQKKLG